MSDPDHTAARLVAAAERLFAEGGEESTSLRAITREARSNAAAVHYHFGGRDELLRAVLDQHLGPLATRRTALLDVARARYGDAIAVDALIEAAVRPDLELLAALRTDRVQVARFLGRAQVLPGTAVAEFVARQSEALLGQLLPPLHAALPGVAEDELRQRLRLVMATVGYLFATVASPGSPGPLGSDAIEEQVGRLVAFCAGAVSAGAVPLGAVPPGAVPVEAVPAGAVPVEATSRSTANGGTRSRSGTTSAAARTMDATSGAAKAGDAKSGAAKAGNVKSGPAKAGSVKSGAAKAGDAKSGAAKTRDAKSGAARTADAKPQRRTPTKAGAKVASKSAGKGAAKDADKKGKHR